MRFASSLVACCALTAGCATYELAESNKSLEQEAVALSKSEIARTVQNARLQLADLDVTWEFSAVGETDQIAYQKQRSIIGAGNFLIEKWYGTSRDSLHSVAYWYDGELFWSYLDSVRQSQATKDRGQGYGMIGAEGEGLFNLMLWFPCHQICAGEPNQLDLLSMLASRDSALRPEIEEINNSTCVVLELREFGDLSKAVWLDVDRNYLPVLWRSYRNPNAVCFVESPDDDQQDWLPTENSAVAAADDALELFMELAVEKFHEIKPGVWMPVKGRRFVPEIPGVLEATEFVIEVTADEAGQYAVTLGEIAEDVFKYQDQLHPRTFVIDLDSDNAWSLGSRRSAAQE